MSKFRFPAFAYVIGLVLLMYATSQAGYYYGQAYDDYTIRGYYTDKATILNLFSPIGTAASIVLSILALTIERRSWTKSLTAFLLTQLFIIITCIWSPVPIESAAIVFKTVVYALGLAVICHRMNHTTIINLASIFALFICVGSTVLSYQNPSFATSIGASGWRGLFEHKNGYAMFCVFMLVLTLPGIFERKTRLLSTVIAPILCLGIVTSQGKTAFTLSVFFAALLATAGILQARRVAAMRTFIMVNIFVAMTLLIAAPAVIALILTENLYITGRVDTWSGYFSSIFGQPYTTIYGFGGYTSALYPEYITQNYSSIVSTSVDSSLVAIFLNWGVVGLIVYFLFIVRAWHIISRLAFDYYAIFTAFTLIVYLVYASVESAFQLNWALPNMVLLLQLMLLEKRTSAPANVA